MVARMACRKAACAVSTSSATMITCPAGTNITGVVFASWGNATGVCPATASSGNAIFGMGACHALETTAYIESQCLGINTCQLPGTNDLPNVAFINAVACPGVTRTLKVMVTCGGYSTQLTSSATSNSSAASTLPALVPPAAGDYLEKVKPPQWSAGGPSMTLNLPVGGGAPSFSVSADARVFGASFALNMSLDADSGQFEFLAAASISPTIFGLNISGSGNTNCPACGSFTVSATFGPFIMKLLEKAGAAVINGLKNALDYKLSDASGKFSAATSALNSAQASLQALVSAQASAQAAIDAAKAQVDSLYNCYRDNQAKRKCKWYNVRCIADNIKRFVLSKICYASWKVAIGVLQAAQAVVTQAMRATIFAAQGEDVGAGMC